MGFPASKAELVSLKLLAVCEFEMPVIKIKISNNECVRIVSG
jgi:hypothetical protein